MSKRDAGWRAAILSMLLSGTAAAELTTGTQAEDGLRFWRLTEDGMSLELVQRLPDQTRAFFQARGFSVEQADIIAGDCIFQTILRNTGSKAAVSYDLNDWRVIVQGGGHGMNLKDEWDRQWQDLRVTESARIAFRWSFLPIRQRFEPGDYNWGMTSYRLSPGKSFELEVAWQREGVRETARIPNVQCAPDVRSLPEGTL